MSDRKIVHVNPDKGGGWKVQSQGGQTLSTHRTKPPAVASAKKAAKEAGTGQVIIHKEDGRIQTEHTYGKDPRRYKS